MRHRRFRPWAQDDEVVSGPTDGRDVHRERQGPLTKDAGMYPSALAPGKRDRAGLPEMQGIDAGTKTGGYP